MNFISSVAASGFGESQVRIIFPDLFVILDSSEKTFLGF
jgi:hypothetical protein